VAPSSLFLSSAFSVNTLTLFGHVLAVGIVVDDAIVVAEAFTASSSRARLQST
jgi:hydrophobic/amphiphilic exporter-1 (mainly G- bacteria), HAE1 family